MTSRKRRVLCPQCLGEGGFWNQTGCDCCEDYYMPCYLCEDRKTITHKEFMESWADDEAEWESWVDFARKNDD